jgi:hypothetical protein
MKMITFPFDSSFTTGRASDAGSPGYTAIFLTVYAFFCFLAL